MLPRHKNEACGHLFFSSMFTTLAGCLFCVSSIVDRLLIPCFLHLFICLFVCLIVLLLLLLLLLFLFLRESYRYQRSVRLILFFLLISLSAHLLFAFGLSSHRVLQKKMSPKGRQSQHTHRLLQSLDPQRSVLFRWCLQPGALRIFRVDSKHMSALCGLL
jgi:hypothetical protein